MRTSKRLIEIYPNEREGTIDKKFAGFEIEIEVKNKQELRKVMQKVRAQKFTTSCKRNINEK